MIDKYFKELNFQGPVNDQFNDTRYWYRKIPNTIHHQLVVREWDMTKISQGKSKYISYEVEMTYETEDGIWATVKFYGLNEEDLKVNLHKLEDRLTKSLLPMGANPMHYRYDGED